MSAVVMPDTTERVAGASPRTTARITGVVYLLFYVTVILGAVLAPEASGLGGASGDAAANANNILAHEASYRVGWSLGLISTACYVARMALFYRLFRVVSRSLALLAAFFGLVGCAITAFGSLFQFVPLVVLGGSPYLGAFTEQQLQALALLLLNLAIQVDTIALLFFGCFQLVIGYLIFQSTFLPRVIGALIALSGLSWLLFLARPLTGPVLSFVGLLGILGEASLMLWLLFMGVNAQRWKEQASAMALRS